MRVYRWAILKYALYVLLAFGLFHLQSSGLLPVFWGIAPMPVAALSISVAMLEKELPAGIFAAFCGYLCDLWSDGAMGYYTFIFFVLTVLAGVLVHTFLHVSAPMTMLMTMIGMTLCRVLVLLFEVVLPGHTGFWHMLVRWELPMAAYTAALAVPVFLLVRYIRDELAKRQETRF